jgi:hypothetical protein
MCDLTILLFYIKIITKKGIFLDPRKSLLAWITREEPAARISGGI